MIPKEKQRERCMEWAIGILQDCLNGKAPTYKSVTIVQKAFEAVIYLRNEYEKKNSGARYGTLK